MADDAGLLGVYFGSCEKECWEDRDSGEGVDLEGVHTPDSAELARDQLNGEVGRSRPRVVVRFIGLDEALGSSGHEDPSDQEPDVA
eukprot:15445079-Alexandrium_andersonii.AAC.1